MNQTDADKARKLNFFTFHNKSKFQPYDEVAMLSTRSEVDGKNLFKVPLQANRKYKIFSYSSEDPKNLAIYDSNFNKLAQTEDAKSRGAEIDDFYAPHSGIYYIFPDWTDGKYTNSVQVYLYDEEIVPAVIIDAVESEEDEEISDSVSGSFEESESKLGNLKKKFLGK